MRFLIDVILKVLTDPRGSADKVIGLRLSNSIILQATLLVAICGTILTYAFVQLIGNSLSAQVSDQTLTFNELLLYLSSIQPLYFTANQVFQMLVFSLIITIGGKLFNGKGEFFEALLCITMVEAVLILVKFLQLILLPFSAILAFAIIIPGVIWSLWAYASAAASIHNFRSTLLTFCGGVTLSILFLVAFNTLLTFY